ncbi:hypothetical protein N7486_001260 [Penicillium sp. IBT 16267x]|nr:hypothetical protein N7486_001260 [Penicillium sp. IBT 16267x]
MAFENGNARETALDDVIYDRARILDMPNLQQGDADSGVFEIQNYLQRYGYLQKSSVTSPDIMDNPTSAALKLVQKFNHLPESGALDDATKEIIGQTRCGLPDILGQSLDSNISGPWQHRDLKYSFGNLTTRVPSGVCRSAVRRALDSWTSIGAGITFTEVPSSEPHDIFIEWRQASDPDHNMVGPILAHADFPPGFSKIVQAPPLPLHFDNEEHVWVDGKVDGGFDIETTCLHEIGHCLGLYHSLVADSVMAPTAIPNDIKKRTLTSDDMEGIHSLYPSTEVIGSS